MYAWNNYRTKEKKILFLWLTWMNFVFDLCWIRKSLVLAIGLGLNLILHKAGHKLNETHTKQIICQYIVHLNQMHYQIFIRLDLMILWASRSSLNWPTQSNTHMDRLKRCSSQVKLYDNGASTLITNMFLDKLNIYYWFFSIQAIFFLTRHCSIWIIFKMLHWSYKRI